MTKLNLSIYQLELIINLIHTSHNLKAPYEPAIPYNITDLNDLNNELEYERETQKEWHKKYEKKMGIS